MQLALVSPGGLDRSSDRAIVSDASDMSLLTKQARPGGPKAILSNETNHFVGYRGMMPAYLIGYVKDLKAYELYWAKVHWVIVRHRGECVIRPGEIQLSSSEWRSNRVVILRFPDAASVRAVLDDPLVHKLSGLRSRALENERVMESRHREP